MSDTKIKQLNTAKRLVLCTIILYVVTFFAMNSPYITVDNIRRLMFNVSSAVSGHINTKAPISFEESKKNNFAIYKDGLIILSQKTLYVYNKDNVLISKHNINFTEPVLKVSDKYIICFERGGNTLYIADSFDIVHTAKYSDKIINVSVDNSGYIAVITESFNYKAKITVMNPDFEDLYYWSSASHYLLDVVFSSKNIISIVSIIPQKELTDIAVHRINFRTGEEIRTYIAKERFPVGIKHKDDNSIEIITDSDIISMRNDGYSILYQFLNETTDIYLQDGKNTIFTSLIDAATSRYKVRAISTTGDKLFEIEFFDVRSVSCYYDVFLVLSEDLLYVIDKNGTILTQKEVSHSAGKIIANRDVLYVLTSDSAQKTDISEALS